jgi:hypothetical protein
MGRMQFFTVTVELSVAKSYGLDGRVRFLAGVTDCSLHSVQTGSGARPASHPMGVEGSFSGGKAAGT